MTGEELLTLVFGAGAIQFGEFKLKMHEKHPDAPLSPIYINLRVPPKGPLIPVILEAIGMKLASWVHRQKLAIFDCVVGLPKTGEPIAESFAHNWLTISSKPGLIYLEKEESEDKRRIIPIIRGEYEAGSIVLMIDDLITTADTKIEGAEALRSKGLIVNDCVVLVDCEQGGRAELAKANVKLHALFTLSDVLSFYQSCGFIDSAVVEKVQNYKKEVDTI